MKKLLLTLALSLVASRFASAQALVAAVSFDDMKSTCQNPAKFHNQVAPANIQLSCKDMIYRWVPDQVGNYTLPTSRLVTASLISDKFSVSPLTATVASEVQVAQCAQYKQVAESVETVRSMSCADVISYTGTSIDFCKSAIDSLRVANANVISSLETGKKISLCGNTAQIEVRALTAEKEIYDDHIEREVRLARENDERAKMRSHRVMGR